MTPSTTFYTSTIEDIDAIFNLYDAAIAYQKTVFHKQWQGFERELVKTEIAEQRQWKIVIDGQIACIFALTFEDALIWGSKNSDPSIYIHRIVTNPAFRGARFVKQIAVWAKEYAPSIGKRFVRMDTWGDNPRLIDYYQECGFLFLGLTTLTKSEGLPKHYEGACLSLFEIDTK
jgi:ribosomal protein S18 acetylase RimI-like enzyme